MDYGWLLQAVAPRQLDVPDLTFAALRLSLKVQYRRDIQPNFRLRVDLDDLPLTGETEASGSVTDGRLCRQCRRSCRRRPRKRRNGRIGRLGQ